MSQDSVVPTIKAWLQDKFADTINRPSVVRNGITYVPIQSFDSAGLQVTLYRSSTDYYVEAGTILVGKYALNLSQDDLLTFIARDYARLMERPMK